MEDEKKIIAGTALADISPKKGIQLAGYPHCPRPNEGVHDSLYAACLYFYDGKQKKALVTADLLAVGKPIVKRIRDNFPDIDITVSASHTHSGPWACDPPPTERAEGISFDLRYIDFLEKTLIALIVKAATNTFPAVIGTHIGSCGAESGLGGNRFIKDGICDPSVSVLAVKDGKGIVRAVLCNYSLHPTYLHAENVLVTADYPGYIRRFVSFSYPEAVFLFAQGASGDQSSRYFRNGQNFEEAARAGTALGATVCECVRNIRYHEYIDIKTTSLVIDDLPIKNYPPKKELESFINEKEQALDAAKLTGDYIKIRNAEVELLGAQNTLNYSVMAEKQYVSSDLPCEIQIISLGDTRIVTFQGEIFVEYGLAVKKMMGENTLFFSISNGYLPGYIYTPEALRQKSYEALSSMFAENAGDIIINQIENHIAKRLKQQA